MPTVNVGPAVETATSILGDLELMSPAGAAPTGVALARAYDSFSVGAGTALDGVNPVVLITDGGPNCNPNLSWALDPCTLHIDTVAKCQPTDFSCCAATPTACLDPDQTPAHVDALASIRVHAVVVL